MREKINLLPTDSRKTGFVVSFLGFTKKANSLLTIVSLVLVLGSTIFFVQNLVGRRGLLTKKEELLASIASLEATEQKLVLVRDRLEYARAILAKKGAIFPLVKFGEIASLLPSDVAISSFDISTDRTSLSAVITTSTSLATMLELIASQTFYRTISVESINFSPENGYFVTLVAIHK